MINRDSRGHSYFIVRGEILGFMKDEQLRKHTFHLRLELSLVLLYSSSPDGRRLTLFIRLVRSPILASLAVGLGSSLV